MTQGTMVSPREMVEACPDLGSPPLIYQRLMEVINHPRGGAGDVANVIRQDTALTARLLKLVNSAFFAFPSRIETVSQAVSVVGTSQVRDLALATSVTALFKDVPADLVDTEGFWRHSLACGVGARVLAGIRREANVERFFVGGILHDVGKLITYLACPDESRAVLARVTEGKMLLHEAETAVLGFDHGRVGGALMHHWNMPHSLRDAIQLHHEPVKASRYPVETAAVHAADIIANALKLGSAGERFVPPMSASAWESLAIDPALLGSAVEEIERQYGAAVHLVGAPDSA